MTGWKIQLKAVLFDLDGVLADSGEEVEDHWRQFASWYGFDGDELIRHTHGVRDSDTITRLLSSTHSQAEVSAVIERYRDLEVSDTTRTVEIRGSKAFFDSIPADRKAVVTSCTRALAEARLNTIGIELPAHSVFAEDVSNGKPDPEGYLTAASRLGFPASECAVFEDSPSGLRAAIASGATPIAVASTYDEAFLRDIVGANGIVIPDLAAVRVATAEGGLVLRKV